MKKIIPILLAAILLAGCGSQTAAGVTEPVTDIPDDSAGIPYVSRFDGETAILLSDTGIAVDGDQEAVFTSHDILYYEDRDTYDSGNPYGEGESWERHSTEEAAAHTVVNIVKPGAYRVKGQLSAGQLRIDLGEDAFENPEAVVELILEDASIICTVAPAILFQNVYECDGSWSTDSARPNVDISCAGAILVLEGSNTVNGSHVAKIFKDKDGEKKLWKQDGAIYSYMSMNVFGPGALDLTADNEGLDTELHLSINGGNIAIRSGNDGINTNEDGVSVTTINAGHLHIIAGLGEEGDGIDSNGYLVINGGTVIASAHPAADAGLDSDMGSYIHGGTVIALGSTMDWAESDSEQVTMNLQFAAYQEGSASLLVAREDGTPVFAYDPNLDPVLSQNLRQYQGMILSAPALSQGDTYTLYRNAELDGHHSGGIYTQLNAFTGGAALQYTGNDVRRGPGGMGPMPGGFDFENMPEDFEPGQRPEGFGPGNMPEDFEPGNMPEGFEPGQMPEDGFRGEGPVGQPPQMREGAEKEGASLFYMHDMVNAFSGITAMK